MTILATEWYKWSRHRFTQGCLSVWLVLLLLLSVTGANLTVLTSVGQLLLLIWISTIVGSEFQWGTIRYLLVNGGTSRKKLGFSWLGSIIFSSLLFTLLLIIVSVLATAFGLRAINRELMLQDIYTIIGAFFSFFIYSSLGFGLAVYAQSTQSALLVGILGFAFEWFINMTLLILSSFCKIEYSGICVPLTKLNEIFNLFSVRANVNLVVNGLSESWGYATGVLCAYIGTALIVSIFWFTRHDLSFSV